MMQTSELVPIIEPILAGAGLELEGIDITPLGKRRLLQITVDGDGPTGTGPLLDELSAASAAISAKLDETQVVGNAPYTLEVTSRGVDAPLREAKHFRRNQGRLVKLWTGNEELTGRIVATSADEVTLELAKEQQTLPLASISKAVVQVELNKAKENQN